MRSISAATRCLSARRSPTSSTSSSSAMREIAEHRGADRVQRADDRHAVGHELLRLLCGRALPDAEHPRRACRRRRRRAAPSRRPAAGPRASPRRCGRASRGGCGTARSGARPRARRRPAAFARPSTTAPARRARARRAAVSAARPASREPIVTSTPAAARRTASPKPSAPDAPMIVTERCGVDTAAQPIPSRARVRPCAATRRSGRAPGTRAARRRPPPCTRRRR